MTCVRFAEKQGPALVKRKWYLVTWRCTEKEARARYKMGHMGTLREFLLYKKHKKTCLICQAVCHYYYASWRAHSLDCERKRNDNNIDSNNNMVSSRDASGLNNFLYFIRSQSGLDGGGMQ